MNSKTKQCCKTCLYAPDWQRDKDGRLKRDAMEVCRWKWPVMDLPESVTGGYWWRGLPEMTKMRPIDGTTCKAWKPQGTPLAKALDGLIGDAS